MAPTTSVAFDVSQLVVDKTRIRDEDGFVGTVRYVGPVASAKKNPDEVYVGVEWDDASRGRHNGSVVCRRTRQLVQHFVCSGGSMSGSFVRPHKIDLGTELSQSLVRSKYVDMDAPLVAPGNILPDAYARTSSGVEKKPIEFVGELKIRKQQQIDSLHRMALRNQGIATVDTNHHHHWRVNHVQELDLGGNLLSSWRTVLVDIMQAFPNLESLSLASNRIGDLDDTLANELLAIQPDDDDNNKRMVVLNLHNCGITSMATLQHLDRFFPCLQDLCIASNKMNTRLEGQTPIEGFKNLKTLDMSSCGWFSWNEHILQWSHLQALETLHLQDNAIEDLPRCSESNGASSYFASLQHLSLSNLPVAEWSNLEGLQGLPALRSLTLRQTPLTSSMGAAEARAHLIARFPSLTALNSSTISVKERSEAERRYVHYVRHVLLLNPVQEGNQDEWLERLHPQYKRLLALHPPPAVPNGAHGSTLATFVLNVTIVPMAPRSCHLEPLHKRLPATLTVSRLKSLCARVFELDYDLQLLHFRSRDEVRRAKFG